MFARLTRSLITFGVVFVAYQAYALMLAPLIDPPSVGKSAGVKVAVTVNPVEKSQKLLSAYFPADHWILTGKPIVIESGPVMLVVDDYKRDNRGRVDLDRCAVVLFPTPRGRNAPRDAVIIEAPKALLQFDQDFNPARGSIGNLVRGVLPGKITIRSDMNEPGPGDDLWVETSDLQMNESRIVTHGQVSFRLGKNRGGGKQMEIILLEEEFKRPGASGFGFNGLKHLEIFEDVRLELQAEKLSLTEEVVADHGPSKQVLLTTAHAPAEVDAADVWAGGRSVYAAPRVAARRAAAPPTPPLEVTCDRSFHLSFLDFTATFNENVLATQLSLTGQSDQLTCDQLSIHFADADSAISPRDAPDVAAEQRSALGQLRPTVLEAIGEPVRMNSPSRGARARSRRLRINLNDRRLTLDGGSPLMVHGGNELRAPVIRYQHPAKGDPSPLGRLWLAGPGQIRVVPKADAPQNVIQAQWNAVPNVEFPVQLVRENGQSILMVEGRPSITSTRLGRITSDRLRAAFRETAPDGPEGPAVELNAGGQRRALMLERMNAVGAVRIESPEINARTNELVMWVRPETEQLALAAPNSSADAFAGAAGRDAPSKSYHLVAQQMQMDLLLVGKRAKPANLVCQGAVRFSEDAPSGAESPLSVEGDVVRVNNLESGKVHVRVEGAPSGGAAALAKIAAQGVLLQSAAVRLDQAKSRLWADGAGSARVNAGRDLFGQRTAASQTLHLKWRGGLDFDGRTIVVKQDVLGEAAHDWVRCQEVRATLSQPIDFANSRARSTRDIDIAVIECLGGVTIDHRSVDAAGQTSHEHGRIDRLTINRATGEITGQGDGSIRSVRLEGAANPFAAAQTEQRAPRAQGQGLQFLRVRFNNGLTGNLLEGRRQVTFNGAVQAVYGPVLEWEQELPLLHPGGLPDDTATLKCEQLTVNEDPLARMTGRQEPSSSLGPIEMRAVGAVQIHGAATGKGLFTAYAHTASYSKAKEEFSLAGDGQSEVTLHQQDQPGARPRTSRAGSLTYWRKTGRVAIGDFSHGGGGPPNAAQAPGRSVR